LKSAASFFPSLDPAWREVAEIYRGICWLRAAGYRRGAARREANELAAAIAAVRRSPAVRADFATCLEAVQVAEEARVTEAIAFAERLAPMETAQLQASAVIGAPLQLAAG
jgi:hypothetical protein